jgi:hypothetical protein
MTRLQLRSPLLPSHPLPRLPSILPRLHRSQPQRQHLLRLPHPHLLSATLLHRHPTQARSWEPRNGTRVSPRRSTTPITSLSSTNSPPHASPNRLAARPHHHFTPSSRHAGASAFQRKGALLCHAILLLSSPPFSTQHALFPILFSIFLLSYPLLPPIRWMDTDTGPLSLAPRVRSLCPHSELRTARPSHSQRRSMDFAHVRFPSLLRLARSLARSLPSLLRSTSNALVPTLA